MIHFPSCYRNAVLCINNLPEYRLLNELFLLMSFLVYWQLVPNISLDNPKPREHRSHSHQWENPKCVDDEGLGGENQSWREGNMEESYKEEQFQLSTSGFLKLAVTSDISAALSLKQKLWTLLCVWWFKGLGRAWKPSWELSWRRKTG